MLCCNLLAPLKKVIGDLRHVGPARCDRFCYGVRPQWFRPAGRVREVRRQSHWCRSSLKPRPMAQHGLPPNLRVLFGNLRVGGGPDHRSRESLARVMGAKIRQCLIFRSIRPAVVLPNRARNTVLISHDSLLPGRVRVSPRPGRCRSRPFAHCFRDDALSQIKTLAGPEIRGRHQAAWEADFSQGPQRFLASS